MPVECGCWLSVSRHPGWARRGREIQSWPQQPSSTPGTRPAIG